MSDDYEQLCRLIRSRADQVGTGCTPDELAALHEAFGALPGDYVAYLTDFGWITVSHHEVIGFGAGVPAHLDVIKVVTWERERAYPPLRVGLLPLANDGAGDHYCLDLDAPGHPVVFWSHDDPHGPGQLPAVVAPSFVAWALALFEGQQL